MKIELELTEKEIEEAEELLCNGVLRLVFNRYYDRVIKQSFLGTYHKICDQLEGDDVLES